MVSSGEQQISSEKLRAGTGRSREEWHALLDGLDAHTWAHPQIAAWVQDQGVDGWWAQGIAIAYEQARGLRVPGQQSDGTFAVNASKTVPGAPLAVLPRVIEYFSGQLDSAPVYSNPAAKSPSARWALADGSGLQAMVSAATNGRSRVAMTRTKLSGPDALTPEKQRLAAMLEGLA